MTDVPAAAPDAGPARVPIRVPARVPAHDHAGPGLWVGLALGVPVVAWGMRGAWLERGRTHPAELARWIAGSAVVHDAVVLPLVLLVGLVVRRLVPPPTWPAVRWGLATTGVVALVSWPFVRGYGRRPSNPSLLPRDYGAGVLLVMAAVWVLTLLVSVRLVRRASRNVSR